MSNIIRKVPYTVKRRKVCFVPKVYIYRELSDNFFWGVLYYRSSCAVELHVSLTEWSNHLQTREIQSVAVVNGKHFLDFVHCLPCFSLVLTAKESIGEENPVVG